MTTTLTQRLAAAAASIAVTLTLLTGVVGLADRPAAHSVFAQVATPIVR